MSHISLIMYILFRHQKWYTNPFRAYLRIMMPWMQTEKKYNIILKLYVISRLSTTGKTTQKRVFSERKSRRWSQSWRVIAVKTSFFRPVTFSAAPCFRSLRPGACFNVSIWHYRLLKHCFVKRRDVKLLPRRHVQIISTTYVSVMQSPQAMQVNPD